MNEGFYRFKSRTYSVGYTIFALLCLLFGYLFTQFSPSFRHPMATFIVIVALLIATLMVIKPKKQRLSLNSILCSLIVLLLGCGIMLSGSAWVVSLSFLLALGTICYMVSAQYGNRIEKGFSNYIFLDYIRALVLPFRAIFAIFDALFGRLTLKSAGYLGKIALGICIAVIPAVVIFSILSYDSDFLAIMQNMFTYDKTNYYNDILDLCIGIFIGMYLFGLFVASEAGYKKGLLTAEICDTRFARLRFLPQITAFSAALPILFIYVVFFISQWKYYVSGFTGILPENFSYAEYAREGFFQLCAVSAINLVSIIILSLFIRLGNSGRGQVLKLLTGIFCLCTLVLIATAVAKLVMYINIYGMTLKRLYAMWAMLVIALVFIIIAIGQFIRSFKTVAVCLCVTAVLFSGLSLCNPSAITAQYNVDRYLTGTLQQLDVEALENLGASAVPAMAKLLENEDTDPVLRAQIMEHLKSVALIYTEGEHTFANYNIPDYLAMDTLRQLGLIK